MSTWREVRNFAWHGKNAEVC